MEQEKSATIAQKEEEKMNRLKRNLAFAALGGVIAVHALVAVVLLAGCQSGGGVVDNPKATPQQNWAALRAVVTLEENTVVTMKDQGDFPPSVSKLVVPLIAKQRARLDATAVANWSDLLDYIGYVPLVFDGVRVAEIVTNANNLTPEEIDVIKAEGVAADKQYDAAID